MRATLASTSRFIAPRVAATIAPQIPSTPHFSWVRVLRTMTSASPQPAGSRLERWASHVRSWLSLASSRWALGAAVIFAAASFSLFHSLLFSDAEAPVLVAEQAITDDLGSLWSAFSSNDLRFVVAVLARNARVLVEAPSRLFDLEHCFPTANALALGEPVITSSILAIPAPWLFSEPTAAFNFALIVTTLLAAAAMYWLVHEWSGSAPAGIVAALLYAFHTIRMRDPVHFYVWDNAWTLLALVFARRLFVAPRWRDAAALALCTSMQIAGSVYPLLVALIVALPLTAWFARTYGLSRVRWGQIALVVAVGAITAWLALGPFFSLQEEGTFHARDLQFYLPFTWLSPGDRFFPGIVMIVLALAGLILPRGADRDELGGDPRFVIGVVLVLCLAFATGGLEGERLIARFAGEEPPETWVPNLWIWLARLIPPLNVVRSPGALLSGVQALACVLAGFGAAALLRRCPPRWAALAATALIVLAWIDTLRPAWLGLTPRQVYSSFELHPGIEVLDFYRELEALGNDGPLYELAFSKRLNPKRTVPLVAAAYHGRATSICYNSFVRRPAQAARERLPDPSGLAEMRALGFTTLIVHDPFMNIEGRRVAKGLRELAERDPEHSIRELLAIDAMTAYEITAEPALPAETEAAPRDES